MSTEVRVDVDPDGVALITLDGPATLNAFGADTAAALSAAYRRCDEDDGVRAVVLTGAGRAFCSGADMSPGATPFAPRDDGFSASPIDPPAWRVRKLVVAAINGHAIGIGLTLALECDVRLVAADARLAIPQVRRGVLGDMRSHATLRRAAGLATAADLLLTGRTITGAEAARRGIATEAYAAEQVLPAALELARDVAQNASPAAVALSKQILWSGADLDQSQALETSAHQVLMGHPDAVEGVRAWQERRAPRWTFPVSELPPL